jgi:hypothetical protein
MERAEVEDQARLSCRSLEADRQRRGVQAWHRLSPPLSMCDRAKLSSVLATIYAAVTGPASSSRAADCGTFATAM